jgi:hypothetical protein
LSDNLSDVLEDFFSEKYDFVRETKIVPQEKNTVKLKEALRKVTILEIQGNHVGKSRYNTEFRTFYWKSRGETNFCLTQQKCDK